MYKVEVSASGRLGLSQTKLKITSQSLLTKCTTDLDDLVLTNTVEVSDFF
jgi:hypothetical protein